ncbi:hypothetical protein FRIGORI9N_330013 [Frigoribacterium sp. 9N]|nr:hypothetical protein FRIGORI9N_330013 [Frigoribacterium sp. 9N]
MSEAEGVLARSTVAVLAQPGLALGLVEPRRHRRLSLPGRGGAGTCVGFLRSAVLKGTWAVSSGTTASA